MMRRGMIVCLLLAGCGGSGATGAAASKSPYDWNAERLTGFIGQVVDERGAPALLVTVVAEDGRMDRSDFSDNEGFFFVPAPPGTYDVKFVYGDAKVEVAGVTVKEKKRVSMCVAIDTSDAATATVELADTSCLRTRD